MCLITEIEGELSAANFLGRLMTSIPYFSATEAILLSSVETTIRSNNFDFFASLIV